MLSQQLPDMSTPAAAAALPWEEWHEFWFGDYWSEEVPVRALVINSNRFVKIRPKEALVLLGQPCGLRLWPPLRGDRRRAHSGWDGHGDLRGGVPFGVALIV